ncbi:DHHC palmitoyltransferase-domain-containing protein [Phlyctochytrium arcticum]|nr:DHHC palmitoyltransferase-domain-containing protein [Phlyctochytrium arcticum]
MGKKGFPWGRLFVVGVTGLILFVPITTQYFIFFPWLFFHPERSKLLWLGPFNIFSASILINYFLGVATDPGRVPTSYNPEAKESTKDVSSKGARKTHQDKRGKQSGKSTVQASPTELIAGKPRWCKTCMVFKPPRSHHCSVCNRCVLKMDHHCPWLNNCIGHENQAYFLRFVVSVTLAALSCMLLLALRIVDLWRYQNQFQDPYAVFSADRPYFYTPAPEGAEVVILIINLVILFLLLLTVGVLSGWQIYYACTNITTIESFENAKIDDLVRKGKIAAEDVGPYPYDLGTFKNVQSVLGSRWWMWWLPVSSPGDGMTFSVNQKTEERIAQGLAAQWPPKAYFQYRKYPHGKPSRGERQEGNGGRYKNTPRVRRGSEGYVVREWTPQERARLLEQAKAPESAMFPKPLIDLGPDVRKGLQAEISGSESESSEEWSASSYGDDTSDDEDFSHSDGDESGNGLRMRKQQDGRFTPNTESGDYIDDGAVTTGCSGKVVDGVGL